MTGQKRSRSPAPSQRRETDDRSAQPAQPANREPDMDEMRRLMDRMETRFLELIRLARAQEEDLRAMGRAMKRRRRDDSKRG